MNRSSPLWELTIARLRLFYREPGALFWTFGFPVLLTVALGIAFRNKPPEPVHVAVVQGEGATAEQAKAVLEALDAAADVEALLVDADAARAALRTGKVAMVVVAGPTPGYELDPTRPESRVARLVVDDALQRARGRPDAFTAPVRPVTEPGGRYIDFLIPGLIGMNVMSSGMWGLGYLIVEMRTRKLLRRMLATPMRRGHFLLSFVLMRLLFLAMEVPVLLVFGALAFGTTMRGSLGLFSVVAVLGALAFSGLGLLVASRAQNTNTVSGLINLVMMPMFLVSGVFFSAATFPDAVQPFIRLLPLTALNDGLRAVMNDGAGLAGVTAPIAILVGWAVATFVAALKFFRWN